MFESEDIHQQNVRCRIERDGLVAEIIRQAYVERLKSHIEAFYEHGSCADVVALCEAFDQLEQKEFTMCDLHKARLIEELLSVFPACAICHVEKSD